MAKTVRNLVEYNGINPCKGTVDNFNQINVDYEFCIPKQKPNIEQLVKVWVDYGIVHLELVKTPVGISLEGQEVTGYKALIVGDILLKVAYVALETEQSLHTAHTAIPFCGYVVLPKDFNPRSVITPSILIEDIHSEQIDCRCIYNNITLMLIIDNC